MSTKTFVSKSAEETTQFAKNFGANLEKGDILALYGDLGAGKTTFIKGLAKGLGYEGKVFSPTFIFMRPYLLEKGEINTLYHIDLYRIEKQSDLKSIGLEDFFADKESTCVVEWPERIEKELPKRVKKIYIEKISDTQRRFRWNE